MDQKDKKTHANKLGFDRNRIKKPIIISNNYAYPNNVKHPNHIRDNNGNVKSAKNT